MIFKQYENYEYIEMTNLTEAELKQGHNDLQECPVNVSLWRELDDELNYRCEEQGMEWPY